MVSATFTVVITNNYCFLNNFNEVSNITLTPSNGPVKNFSTVVPRVLDKVNSILVNIMVILMLSTSVSALSDLILTSDSALAVSVVGGRVMGGVDRGGRILAVHIFIIMFVIISTIVTVCGSDLNCVTSVVNVS